jgi:hypothetical protein
MRLARLLATPPGALADRARQEIQRRVDRRQWERGRRRAAPPLDAPAASAALERFRHAVQARFFAGAVSAAVPALMAARFPDTVARLLAAADAACRGRFDLLGYRALDFGDPIDWHLDPVAGRRTPRLHASRVDPLDAAVVGDSKVVWELNRHQWLVGLGQAWALTGDERYARAFTATVERWLDANPPGVGINWTSSLEVALRLVAWSWALALFRRAEAVTPAFFARVRAAVADHARHARRYLSRDFSPNTHLTGEALGLLYAGLLFADLRGAAGWRRTGVRVLVRELDRQVLADGVYFEQSTCYARYTADIYLHLLLLAERNGLGLPRAVRERTGALLAWLVALRRPDGAVPSIGDADGGRLLPLAPRAPDDFDDTLAVGAAVLGRTDLAPEAGVPPEAVWLLGEPTRWAGALRPNAHARPRRSAAFPAGGWVVMREGDDHLVFDAGPLGCPVSGGHGHADLLAVSHCSAGGEAFLVDGGTGDYADPERRAFFRSTAAHSTVSVDGQSQAHPRGPFGWWQRPRARLRRWVCTPAFDFADAEHDDAYRRLSDPVRHRRRVVFDRRGRCWVIVDDLQARAEHRVEIRWQFAPLSVSLEGASWARARGRRGELLVGTFSAAALKLELDEGALLPPRGWVSPAYGVAVPAPALTCAEVTRLPLRVVTVLLPVTPGAVPDVAPLRDGDGALAGCRVTGRTEIEVSDHHVRVGDAVGRW